MDLSEISIRTFVSRASKCFVEVTAPGFQAVESEGAEDEATAYESLIKSLVLMVHDRNVKIKAQRDTIDGFAKHKLAISQYGPQSPASTAKVRDPETGEWVDASEQDERDSGGAEVDKDATPTSG